MEGWKMYSRVGVIGFGMVLMLVGCGPTNEPEYEPPDVYGNGIIISDTIAGQPFAVVDVWDGCKTTIVQDSVCRAIVSADENLLGHGIGASVRASRRGSELSIFRDDHVWPTQFTANVWLPRITALSFYHAECDFTSGLTSDTTVWIWSIMGGKITGTLHAPGIDALIAQSALTVSGTVPRVILDIRNGYTDFSELLASHVTVSSDDGTTVKVYCTDTLIVSGKRGSHIYCRGDPRHIVADLDSTSFLKKL
ncbi:MAG: DUF2807 domain-containing protein [Bacteroidetes bacterium]|nr:DUF2807 domain-containing protein [Bacteroidota bacterium]